MGNEAEADWAAIHDFGPAIEAQGLASPVASALREMIRPDDPGAGE